MELRRHLQWLRHLLATILLPSEELFRTGADVALVPVQGQFKEVRKGQIEIVALHFVWRFWGAQNGHLNCKTVTIGIRVKLLSTLALMLICMSGHADVVKPTSTLTPVSGNVIVDGLNFTYQVEDQGWFSSYESETGTTKAQKTFRFDYEITPFDARKNPGAKDALEVDASTKCAELGQIEYPGQIANLPQGMVPSLTTGIIISMPGDTGGSRLFGFYFCQVNITALKQ
jgi:hypothetical protein